MSSPPSSEQRLTAAFLIVAHVALFGGVVTGLFQSLEHAGVNVYRSTPLVKRPTSCSLSKPASSRLS